MFSPQAQRPTSMKGEWKKDISIKFGQYIGTFRT